MGWLGLNVTIWRHLVGHRVKVPTLVQHLLLLLQSFLVAYLFDSEVVAAFTSYGGAAEDDVDFGYEVDLE